MKKKTSKPKPKRTRRPWKPRFIHALSLTGNVGFAAKAAGVERTVPYQEFGRDPEFKAAFENARELAADRLEREAFRRAHDGCRKPIAVNGKTHWVREYSDTLLIFLLKAARPGKYRENHRVELSNPDGSNLQIDARQQTINFFNAPPDVAEQLLVLSRMLYPADDKTPTPAPALPLAPPAEHLNGNGNGNGNGAHHTNGSNGTQQ